MRNGKVKSDMHYDDERVAFLQASKHPDTLNRTAQTSLEEYSSHSDTDDGDGGDSLGPYPGDLRAPIASSGCKRFLDDRKGKYTYIGHRRNRYRYNRRCFYKHGNFYSHYTCRVMSNNPPSNLRHPA